MTATEPEPTAATLPADRVTVYDVLDRLRALATSESDKGARFERLCKAYFRIDPMWAEQFDEIWLWSEWEGNGGKHDAGIDLVARLKGTVNQYTAIQSKFYAKDSAVTKDDIDTFLSASGKIDFVQRIIITTNNKWSHHAEDAIKDQQVPVRRIGLSDLEASPIDWSRFSLEEPDDLTLNDKKKPRQHQLEAIADVVAGFQASARGKCVMACGAGKTLTSLRLTEQIVGANGLVLYLVPSIALLAQSLREWVSDAELDITPLAVCSDPKVSQKGRKGGVQSKPEDISVVDLALPATTNIDTLAARLTLAASEGDTMTVVFATYQSIDVVAKAQAHAGLGPFDLILCDEAHRTTGVTLAGDDESLFVRVHDNDYIQAERRLYMTATPRIYNDATTAKGDEADAVITSMDNEEVYGPEFHRLGFGEAVSRGLLTDYKVLVLAVDEGSVARAFQNQLADERNELQLDDYAKLIGCWNGLSKRGKSEHSFAEDPAPMRRAIAFAGTIRASVEIAEMLPEVVNQYIETHDLDVDNPDADDADASDEARTPQPLRTEVQHVDGSMSAIERNTYIDWLKGNADSNTCRILSNARCLSEGVDVPDLDAVLFLSPRRSVVDVIQSVGRVMRKPYGREKKYGYIILPIAIPAGQKPEDALRDNDRYRVVWDVLQALRAHDDRFDAIVNKIDLNKTRSPQIDVIGVHDNLPDGDTGEQHTTPDANQHAGQETQLELPWQALEEWRDAIYARIVKKVGSRRYWETWANDIAQIAATHVTRINALLDSPDTGIAEKFEDFLNGLRANLNGSISQGEAVEMLAQHLITRPVFDALFEEYAFAEHNPVARTMQQMLDVLDEHRLDNENESLEKFYESVRIRAAGIDNAEGRQRIIVDLYDNFFKKAFPDAVARLGIVYTPLEVVDFIIASTDWVLRKEFGQGLTDEGVHILDGFTGTGTFVVRLIQSGLITPHDLARKFTCELHANEFLLLAYYIAAVNIETAFHDLLKATDSSVPYRPFEGLVLTDTFQSYEDGDESDLDVFPTNNERIERQRNLDIRVLIGNPPYSSGQDDANDNNANESYPHLDAAIRSTYAALSTATLKNKLYDSYIRAIKWATLRVKDRGVISFVTNGGWLDGNVFDGMRKSLLSEFASIYVFNLRGNQRTSGEESRREGGKIFDAGSRNTVAIFLLVKNAQHDGPATLYYRDIGDYLDRKQKLRLISETGSMEHLQMEVLVPNEAGDWASQRSDDFVTYASTDDLFSERTYGVNTGRDSWVYQSSRDALNEQMARTIETYNDAVRSWKKDPGKSTAERDVAATVTRDARLISWSSNLLKAVPRGKEDTLSEARQRDSVYRPFFKQRLYCDPTWNSRPGTTPRHFSANRPNLALYVVGMSSAVPFSVLMVDAIPNLHLTGAGSGGAVFTRYRYEPVDSGDLFGATPVTEEPVIDGYRRIDNINDSALTRFRRAYGDHITKDDIFLYIYGLLHSPEYRARYAADLKKMLPRIPLVEGSQPFIDAGRELSNLHVNYETADRYPLGGLDDLLSDNDAGASERYRVTKMRYGKVRGADTKLREDKTTIVYNKEITLTDIPEAAHRYKVGAKSAVDWLVERYKDDTDKKLGIRNDANNWSREVGNPRYIVDLIARVVTVSVQTVKLVDSLPALSIRADQGA